MTTTMSYVWNIVRNPVQNSKAYMGLLLIPLASMAYLYYYPDTVYRRKLGYLATGSLTLISFQNLRSSGKLLCDFHREQI